MFVIYTKPNCPFCVKAKRLLDGEMEDYIERDISNTDYRKELLKLRPEAKTVPQIFRLAPIGGYEDLEKEFD